MADTAKNIKAISPKCILLQTEQTVCQTFIGVDWFGLGAQLLSVRVTGCELAE